MIIRTIVVMLIGVSLSGCVSSHPQTEPETITHRDMVHMAKNNKMFFVQKTGHQMQIKSFDIRPDTMYYTREVLWQDRKKKIATKRLKYLMIESPQRNKEKRQTSRLIGVGIGVSLGLAWRGTLAPIQKDVVQMDALLKPSNMKRAESLFPSLGCLADCLARLGRARSVSGMKYW